jgi:hypothetical protein
MNIQAGGCNGTLSIHSRLFTIVIAFNGSGPTFDVNTERKDTHPLILKKVNTW